MRVILIYPPPWKITADGDTLPSRGEGPPQGRENMTLGGDFIGPPYGMLQLAAEARRAGYDVTPLNLSTFAWSTVEKIVESHEAELWGLSMSTANRRGGAMLARQIRNLHPAAHIVAGGPHPTALPRETLEGVPAIDTLVLGEGEESFLELCRRLATNESTRGTPGTAWRDDQGGPFVQFGPPRETSSSLDDLELLHRHFDTPFLMTSRGCPGRCTFCQSRAMRKAGVTRGTLRFSSSATVLDALELIVRDRKHRLVAIKDDTFTANRRRALEICRGIRDRDLRFLWLCDTRADSLDEELLSEMRQAGCQQISLGVESGSNEILRRLNKKVDVETIRQATRLAKSLGITVRYYLILGSPGETLDTLNETLTLLDEEKPNVVVMSAMSSYPGTVELERLIEAGVVTTESYLSDDFWTPVFFHDVDPRARAWISDFLEQNSGIATYHRFTVAELRAALQQIPNSPAASMDLAVALVEAGATDEPLELIDRAVELGYPYRSIGSTLRAVMAQRAGDIPAVERHIMDAAQDGELPLRHVMVNLERFEAWRHSGSPDLSSLLLEAHPTFDIVEKMIQPMNPGPLQ